MDYIQECRQLLDLQGREREKFRIQMVEQRVQDISIFMNEDRTAVLEKMKLGTSRIKEEWERINPKTDEEILEFYKQTNCYVYELSVNECGDSRAEQTLLLLQKMTQQQPARILVYGAGIGTEAIPLAESSVADITAMDVASKHFKFMNWRVMTRQLNIHMQLVKSAVIGQDIVGMYDAIVCFDVLEHVPDAEGLARAFYDHLNPNGLLLAEFMFNKNSGFKPEKQNTHPLHIERNKQGVLLRGAHFKSYLRNLGFKCDWKLYGSSWLKELRK